MLNKWFRLTESAPVMESTTVISAATSSNAQMRIEKNTMETSASTNSNSGETNKRLTPPLTPFRKKAITSIERTRKLSILLKHQRYLVS